VQNGGSNITFIPSWRIDRHIVNKHGGCEGSYGRSLLKSYQTKKGKARTWKHFRFIKAMMGSVDKDYLLFK